MNEDWDVARIEELIRSAPGPSPGAATKQVVMDEARKALDGRSGRTRRRSVFAARWGYAAAAVLAAAGLIVAVSLWWMGLPVDRVVSGTLQAAAAHGSAWVRPGEAIPEEQTFLVREKAVCRLAHGSELTLEHGTEFALADPGPGERVRLRIIRGQAFLRVARAPDAFVILGSSGRVEVEGTIFGVKENGRATWVGVLKGRVALASGGRTLQIADGQSGRSTEDAAPELTDIDPARALLWARETRRFVAVPLREVLEWVAENSSYTFDLPPDLDARLITITIEDDPMPEVIDVLFTVCEVPYAVKGFRVTAGRSAGEASGAQPRAGNGNPPTSQTPVAPGAADR
jgi:ferric-dicitrate binding protein FerR (iron transport regulator)